MSHVASKSGQEAASVEHVGELLDAVDKTLDRLKTLYEQYFLGIQKQAPAFIHSDVERKLRDLTQLNIRNTGLRYRLATLQQKFGSYNSYWRRTLRQIENGTYLRNLAKIGREAARNGTEIPEEILAAMPKRMREQVLRDRDQALATAKRRKQLEDETLLALADDETKKPTKTATGAHIIEDEDIDFNELFSAFEDDAPKLDRQKQPTRPPAGRRSPTTRPPLPRMPVPATKPPAPSASPAKPSASDTPPPPSATTPSSGDASTPVARVALKQQVVTASPRPGSQPPNPAVQATGPIPRPTAATPTQAIPRPVGHAPTGPTQAVPRPPGVSQTGPTQAVPRPVGASPSGPTQGVPRPVGQTPSAPQTGPIPRPQTGPVPTTQPVPRVAPSQQSRPVPVVPGSAAQTGPVAVESMSGPFPRIPTEKSGPTSQRTQSIPKPAAPLKPPPGMTEADVNALHAKYVKAKQMIGEKVDPGSRDKLLRTIHQTAPKIMQQYKASGVDFSVVVKDNQVVIKAKPKT